MRSPGERRNGPTRVASTREVTETKLRSLFGTACALLLVNACQAGPPGRSAAGKRAPVVRTGLDDAAFRRIAVLVGVDRYRTRDVKVFPDLHGCQADVKRLGQLLYCKYNFWGPGKRGVPSPPIVLLNEDATKDKILKTLNAVAEGVRKNDQVLFYFSGYGSYAAQPTLCPYDALPDSPARDVRSGDLVAYLGDRLRRRGAKSIVILDCSFCPPRAITPTNRAAVPQKRAGRVPDGEFALPSAEALDDSVGRPLQAIIAGNGVLISACAPGEIAREVERGDDTWASVFTRFVSDGLAEQGINDTVNYQTLVDTITPQIRGYVADRFPGDPYNQTPRLYTGGTVAASLFNSKGAAQAARPDVDRVRLRLNCFGDDPKFAQTLGNELAACPYLQLTDDQPDLTLTLLTRPAGVQGQLTNSAGEMVDELSYWRSGDVETGVTAFQDVVMAQVQDEVNKRVGGLLAYRWPGKLARRQDDAGAGLRVKMMVTNARGEQVDQITAGEPVTVTITAEKPCYFTFYAILPSGDFERRPSRNSSADGEQLSPGQPWQKTFKLARAARYRFLVIAKDKPDVSSDEILLRLWESTHRAEAGVEGSAAWTPEPSYLPARCLCREEVPADLKYEARVADLAIVRLPAPAAPLPAAPAAATRRSVAVEVRGLRRYLAAPTSPDSPDPREALVDLDAAADKVTLVPAAGGEGVVLKASSARDRTVFAGEVVTGDYRLVLTTRTLDETGRSREQITCVTPGAPIWVSVHGDAGARYQVDIACRVPSGRPLPVVTVLSQGGGRGGIGALRGGMARLAHLRKS